MTKVMNLLRQKVTLKTLTSMSVQELLQAVVIQVDGTLELYAGHHGEVARPSLWCAGKTERFITIARTKPTDEPPPR
jgi:hypothetical protein